MRHRFIFKRCTKSSQDVSKALFMRVTPPPFGTQYSGFFRRYAVRKGLVRSTQKFCKIVRRHNFLR